MPDVKSFSPRNLLYMHQFYRLYSEETITPQAVAQLGEVEITPQDVAQMNIFMIPWGHHRFIIDKCKDDRNKALFYVEKTLENNWSRAVLQNFLDTNLYERQGKAISNFEKTLPAPQSDLAQEMTKDPYNFDFLTITEGYYEKELKDALMNNISQFLLELGTGFAFVGREYRLEVGDTEQFIDMLFYNITLHCYVVIEVKIRAFEPGDMGQIGTYVAAVDGILRKEGDAPTVGLLVCKNKDNVLAQYAVNSSNAPVGISEYELSDLMPDYSEVVIETSNLIMKKAVFDDWEQLYRNITSRPESAKYMLWKIDDSEEESKDRMLRTLDFQSKEKYALTVYLKTESGLEAIGWASMREVNPGVYEDMGIAIGPDFVGKGYGKQILNALCDEARNQGAKEFHCSYREKNLASKRLQDVCGFKFDYRSEEKTDSRTGEIYVVVNAKKDLQYVV